MDQQLLTGELLAEQHIFIINAGHQALRPVELAACTPASLQASTTQGLAEAVQ